MLTSLDRLCLDKLASVQLCQGSLVIEQSIDIEALVNLDSKAVHVVYTKTVKPSIQKNLSFCFRLMAAYFIHTSSWCNNCHSYLHSILGLLRLEYDVTRYLRRPLVQSTQ